MPNYNQSNNQFEEAATQGLKSQPHPGFIKREFSGASGFNQILVSQILRLPTWARCFVSVNGGVSQKLQSCAILMGAQAIFCSAQKHTRVWFSSGAANFLLLRALTKFTAGVSFEWSFEISARDKGRGRT